jgi:two-component system response regulator NreC
VSNPISVVLADDHAMFRAGLSALIGLEDDIEVVGEASNGDEAVDQARRLKPDVVVMDISMPGSGGLEATRRIAALGLDSRVLVLTVHAEEEYLVPVVQAGASGYLTKTSADRELIDALRTVARGQVYLPPRATTLLLREYKKMEHDDDARDLQMLSTREQEVLALTAEGYSSREIGQKLFISPKTVDTYRSRITSKLGLDHRSELVRFALRTGLLRE